MRKLLLMFVLYLHMPASRHPEGRSVLAGFPEKPDSLEKTDGDNGRTYDLKHTINISQGTSCGRAPTGSKSHSLHSTARGGGALIPVYTAGARNHHRGVHHSGGGCDRWSCSGVRILVTTVLISFCIIQI
ncbi:uncharacterized protein LOC116188495 [Punica granatum]|uniref:Uncharacterized protein n=2 Tax=Punica granatum TaxID=22663 RepID=A0A218XTR5_PUNGR|nr:uncharacterized protein LOC116188495 [Punica granatum]OWM87652.1 hypothetical protein CDL15_Pgr022765 [Punica granatum]PKI40222.1 hypothetical protein CRG98_039379 [Punica granatum]